MLKAIHFRSALLAALLLAMLAAPAAGQLLNITTTTLPGGQVGMSYNATIQMTGGTPPRFVSLFSGSLPPGILISPASGIVYGTPTQAGTFNFTVRAHDSSAPPVQEDFQALTIVVTGGGSITVSPASLPTVPVGAPFNIQLTASGGAPPYFFEFTFSPQQPPAWLNLEHSGQLFGTPPAAGSYPFGVMVIDEMGAYAEKAYTLIVGSALSITTPSLPAGTVGQPYSASLAATGGSPPYTYQLVQGTLPPGVTLNSAGVFSGTPASSGTYPIQTRATDTTGASADKGFSIAVQPPALDFTPVTLPQATRNSPYSASFTPSGAASGYSFTIYSGALPAGLSMSGMGVVSGTPTASGTYSFTVRLMAGSSYVDKVVQLVVGVPSLSITQSMLPDGTTGQPYSAALSALGGVPPYSFSSTGGALPQGVSLGADGRFAGTPSMAGVYQFSATVNDSAGNQTSALYTLNILAPLALAPDTLPAAKPGEPYDTQLQATGGKPPYSYQLSGSLPPGVAFSNGLFSGVATAPGIYEVAVKLTDSGGRALDKVYRLTVPSNVQITTASALPAGQSGQQYSAAFAAADGVPPYNWSAIGNLPPGMTLNSGTGVLSGEPAGFGSYSFGIMVTDATESSALRTFTVEFALPPVPPAAITQLGATASPAQQPAFGIRLNQAYPVTLNGVATLAFTPDRFGDDPAVLFSNGSRTMAFTIPAGRQTADFGSILAALQTGTVAGNITLTVALLVDGRDVTPAPAPRHTIRIMPVAPVISKLEINRVSGGFELVVTGYSTPRQMTQAAVKLTPASGSAIATSEFTLPLESAFNGYYGGSASAPYGSQFRLVIPFFVPQGVSGLGSASVTLSNSVGSSNTASANF
ncbi:MAG: hypothetical protein C0504_02735 [Candidatus Solibacter sp.]|nr:hypothetical protein [Candidatus Solibacter sp.]